MTRGQTIAMVAGEASGDHIAASLATELRSPLPHARLVGIGGPRMQSAGLESWYPMETLSVRGYAEAAKSVPGILAIRRQLAARLKAEPPDLFIGVDAPDFNLGLEANLRSAGIRTVQYVSPSIWAWRGERIHKIARSVDHVLALFPFEVPIYQKAGVPVTFVGHPLADDVPAVPDQEAARDQIRLPMSAPVFALLPGSRRGELEQHAELVIETAKRVLAQVPDARFLVPLATRPTRSQFEQALYDFKGQDLPMTVLFGHAQLAMIAADVVLVASGTATLEAALLRRPMVITYRVPKLTYRLMWPKRLLPYIGLPNVLAGGFVAPEILQDDATAENLAMALVNTYRDKVVRDRQSRCFEDMYRLLRCGAAERAADAVMPLLRAPAPARRAVPAALTEGRS
ncbi:MAG: lipid-A-disaccharide synthase [Betaproteobacteria bacterium]|nr:lipid-A-disaccharide synthase [Betaproteobacteria bacterium]